MSRVPQGPVFGPVLFSMFINNLNNRIKCTLSKFSDDVKLSDAVDITKGKNIIQRDLAPKLGPQKLSEVQQG